MAKGRLVLLSRDKLQVLTHAEWDDAKEEALFGIRLGDELPGFRAPGPRRAAKMKAEASEDSPAVKPGRKTPDRYNRRNTRQPDDYEVFQPALPLEPAAA